MMEPSRQTHLNDLLMLLMDGSIDEDQLGELRAILADNLEARQYYIQFIVLNANLHRYIGTCKEASPRKVTQPVTESVIPDEQESQEAKIKAYAQRQLATFLAQQEEIERLKHLREQDRLKYRWHLTLDLAQIARGIDRLFTSSIRLIVGGAVLTALILASVVGIRYQRAQRVIATLEETQNARWADRLPERELRVGWLELQNGFARIQFHQGVQVIVQAPSEFRLCGPNKLYLTTGTITAKILQAGAHFEVETLTSHITDRGTEFGVSVNAGHQTEVHVFDGRVELQTQGEGVTQKRQVSKGQAAQINTKGDLYLHRLARRPRLFVRDIPDPNQLGMPGKQLDLADIAAGGNGFGTGQPGIEIDPLTGVMHEIWPDIPIRNALNPDNNSYSQSAKLTWTGPRTRTSASHFAAVRSHGFIDGIFIPDGGSGPVVTSTLGHRFTGCPDTDGSFMEGVVSSLFYRHGQRCDVVLGDHWYTQPGPRQSFLYLHTNLGVTFDLGAIRQTLPSQRIVGFRTQVANAENNGKQEGTADIYVLVDGKVVWHETDLRTGMSARVRIALEPQDQFLSLVTLEGANGISLDRIIFVKPILKLAPLIVSD